MYLFLTKLQFHDNICGLSSLVCYNGGTDEKETKTDVLEDPSAGDHKDRRVAPAGKGREVPPEQGEGSTSQGDRSGTLVPLSVF